MTRPALTCDTPERFGLGRVNWAQLVPRLLMERPLDRGRGCIREWGYAAGARQLLPASIRPTESCACGAIGQRGPEGGKAMARGQRIVLWIAGLPAIHLTEEGEACHASLSRPQLRY